LPMFAFESACKSRDFICKCKI